jgi:hypothetical protein
VNLEKGIVGSLVLMASGAFLLLSALWQWKHVGWGPLEYSRTMRYVVPGVTMVAFGFQTILSSFFVSILGMGKK